jgi:hypothetical protein
VKVFSVFVYASKVAGEFRMDLLITRKWQYITRKR